MFGIARKDPHCIESHIRGKRPFQIKAQANKM